MKLIPKARPVRIRISSGGMEHSSLMSLKEHFSLEDVMGLIANGSLTRWLKQCGESDLASEMECASEGDKMEVLKSFFPELNRIKPEIELVKYLYHSGQEKTAAYLFNSDLINDINAIKQAWMYYIGGINYFPLFYNHWEEDGELAFLFAQACANGDFEIQDHNSVVQVLDKAIELGSRQAENFKTSDAWQEYMHSNDRFRNVDKEKMKPIVMSIFNGGLFPQGLSDDEYIIAYFARLCFKMATKFDRGFLYSELLEDLDKFGNKESIIGPEIELMKCILHASGRAKLKLMEEKTPLIDLYLNTDIIQKRKFKDKLSFILLHLFDDKIEL